MTFQSFSLPKRFSLIISSALIFGSLLQSCSSSGVDIDPDLAKAASLVNSTCPMMVDAETQLDNAAALPHNEFRYNYTMVNYALADIDVDGFEADLKPGIVNSVRTNPDMKYFRDNKVTVSYAYSDMDGKHIATIEVKPTDYES